MLNRGHWAIRSNCRNTKRNRRRDPSRLRKEKRTEFDFTPRRKVSAKNAKRFLKIILCGVCALFAALREKDGDLLGVRRAWRVLLPGTSLERRRPRLLSFAGS